MNTNDFRSELSQKMGKPKSHSAKAKKLARQKGLLPSSGPAQPSYTVEELLDKATDLMEEYKYDLAQKFCQRALEQDSDHPRALEMTGNLLLEMGQVEKAQQCFGRAIFVQPEVGHTKYLTAAQLFPGTDSRNLYLKGIEVLQASVSAMSSQCQAEARAELATAFVALSELYMTDLCDEEDAESQADRFLTLAVEADPGHPEPWQGRASLCLVLGDTVAAGEALEKSLALWLPQHLAYSATGDGEQTSLSYNTRLGTVKLLLDLEQFDRAASILDSLLEEDDEVVEPWYLHGWLNYLRDDPDYHGNVRHYLAKARQVHVMNPTEDVAMVEHITELLAEVGEEEAVTAGGDKLEYSEENEERAEQIAEILDTEKEEGQEAMED